jgi:exopolysaccharide production protein ExoY
VQVAAPSHRLADEARAEPSPIMPAAPATSRTKRALDLVVVLAVLPVVLAVMGLVVVLIRLTSRGPAFFSHERIGLHGKRFRMYKFRTMHRDAESDLQNDRALWEAYVRNGYKVPAELDRRVTRIGRLLRRSSLDELPQVLNVISGSMSLVGPRPIVPDELANYGADSYVYLSVRPGITGAWQVNGRSCVAYPERIEFDRDYAESWTFWRDVSILARTPLAVLSARGAF